MCVSTHQGRERNKREGTYVPLGDVPHTDCSILTIRDDEFVLRVEEHARDVVSVSAHSVNFPSLLIRCTIERNSIIKKKVSRREYRK